MSRVTFYSIACLMVLTTVVQGGRRPPPPETVTNVGVQCRNRGLYTGACLSQNLINDEFGCLNLVCAKWLKSARIFEAYNTGVANNGTPCGVNKFCQTGVCVQREIGSTKGSWVVQAGLRVTDTLSCTVLAQPILVTSSPKPIAAPQSPPKKRA